MIGIAEPVPSLILTAAEAAQYGALIAEQEAVTHTPMYEAVPQAAQAPKGKQQAAQADQEVSNG